MKALKKIISLILTAVIMVNMVCIGTVSAIADTSSYQAYIGNKNGNYILTITGFSDEEVKFLKAHGEASVIDISFYDEICGGFYFYYSVEYSNASAGNYSGDYFPVSTNGLKKVNGIWEITFEMNAKECASLIEALKKQYGFSVMAGYVDDNYIIQCYYDTIGYAGVLDYEYYEGQQKEVEKEAAVKALGNPPKKSNKENGNYTIKGYYNKGKTKYCIEIGGISKKEYQYLWDCYNYYNKYDEAKGNIYCKRRIIIELTQYYGGVYTEKIEINADITNSLFYLYKGKTDTYNSYWKNTSKDLSGDLIDNGDTYSYVFYIDLSTDKGKKITEELNFDGYHQDPSVTIMCTEEDATPEIVKDGLKGAFSNYSYYKKGWVYVEETDYTKNTGSAKGTVTDVFLSSSLSSTSKKDISSLSISKISNKTYTGKSVKPSVTVKDGDKTLKKGTDYTLSYKNNKKIGTATVTIKGKGDYTGEKTIEFKIVPKKTTLKVSKKSDTKATFSWTAVDGAEKYQIYYSKDGGKTYKLYKSVSGSKTSYTSSKLDFEKYDYKFKIRSYGTSDGKKYYSSYSKVKTVK